MQLPDDAIAEVERRLDVLKSQKTPNDPTGVPANDVLQKATFVVSNMGIGTSTGTVVGLNEGVGKNCIMEYSG